MKLHPLTWRNSHPYMIVDHYEDVTDPSQIKKNPKVNRKLLMYGWTRGTNWNCKQNVHFLGVGDFNIDKVGKIEDPCPISFKRKSLNEKDKNLFAPMSDVGNLVFEQNETYTTLKRRILNEVILASDFSVISVFR
jgi:ribosome biogenesis protein BMS1